MDMPHLFPATIYLHIEMKPFYFYNSGIFSATLSNSSFVRGSKLEVCINVK